MEWDALSPDDYRRWEEYLANRPYIQSDESLGSTQPIVSNTESDQSLSEEDHEDEELEPNSIDGEDIVTGQNVHIGNSEKKSSNEDTKIATDSKTESKASYFLFCFLNYENFFLFSRMTYL